MNEAKIKNEYYMKNKDYLNCLKVLIMDIFSNKLAFIKKKWYSYLSSLIQ